jgi:phage gp16-like protein
VKFMTDSFKTLVTEGSNHSIWLTNVPKIFGYNTVTWKKKRYNVRNVRN